MESVRFQSRKSKVIMIALIVAVLAAGCFVAFFSTEINVKAKDLDTLAPEKTITKTFKVKAGGNWAVEWDTLDFYFNSGNKVSAYEFSITGKDSKGNKIPVGNVNNFANTAANKQGEIQFAYRMMGCDNSKKEYISTPYTLLTNNQYKLKFSAELFAQKKYSLKVGFRKGGTYTLTIKQSSDSKKINKGAKRGNGQITDSYIWENVADTICYGDKPVLVAYLNRYDVCAFYERIKKINSKDNSAAVAMNIWKTYTKCIGLIPTGATTTAAIVLDYIGKYFNSITFSSAFYSDATQTAVINALKTVKGLDYQNVKNNTFGVKVVIRYNTKAGTTRLKDDFKVEAKKWYDDEEKTIYGNRGNAGVFVKFTDWNVNAESKWNNGGREF